MVDRKEIEIKLLLLSTVVAIAAFLVREIVDADTWWQVAIGRDIIGHFAVPSIDSFSAAGWGRPYHDSHWLFQVMLGLGDRIGGMTGVSVITLLIWGVAFAVTYRTMRRWLDPAPSAVMLFLTAIACSDRFTPRPDTVSCLMIALFYRLLLDEAWRSYSGMAVLFLLQAVWANSHGLFVIGPFMVGCYLLSSLSELKTSPEKARKLGVLLVGAVIASMLTPFGIDGWHYALLLASEAGAGAPEFFKRITELAPTFGASSIGWPDFWGYLLLLLSVSAALIPAISGRRPDAARLMLVAGLSLASFTGRRNIPLFVLAAAPFIAENLSLRIANLRGRRALGYAAGAGMLAMAALPLSGRYYQWLNYPIRFGTGVSPSYFPERLPPLLQSAGFKGQIYNANYLGGFLLYHGYLPLTDGRWELYDPKELDRIFAAPNDRGALNYLLSRYSVTGILMQHTSAEAAPLLPQLAKDPGWRLVYLDVSSSFWLRSDLPSSLRTVDMNRLLPMNPADSRAEEYLMLGTFYRLVNAWSAAESAARQGLAVGGKRMELIALLGAAQRDSGQTGAAEATFRQLLREFPRNPEALNELAYFAYSRGDASTALRYLKAAAAITPGDASIRANIERIERAYGRR